ncbi:hypothetical protein ZWY2020_005420 [Hordeum vulgare]|nr:hypothetical protein ZWY2020_005420 [Hordeum vulgare]
MGGGEAWEVEEREESARRQGPAMIGKSGAAAAPVTARCGVNAAAAAAVPLRRLLFLRPACLLLSSVAPARRPPRPLSHAPSAPRPLPSDGEDADDGTTRLRGSRNEKKREARRAVKWGMELAKFSLPRSSASSGRVAGARGGGPLMLVKKFGPDVRRKEEAVQLHWYARKNQEYMEMQIDGLRASPAKTFQLPMKFIIHNVEFDRMVELRKLVRIVQEVQKAWEIKIAEKDLIKAFQAKKPLSCSFASLAKKTLE